MSDDTSKTNSAKRLKLSLKSRKASSSPSVQNSDCPVDRYKGVVTANSKLPSTTGDQANANSSIYASLANLGNTCFMNSILNVLRYSPGFLAHLHNLCSLIGYLKNDKNKMIPLSWQLVNQLHEVYSSLSNVEKCVKNNSDVQCTDRDEAALKQRLVIYPQELLSTLRQLNSLFEGNFQHDAHELLCCFLNYIREAEHGVVGVLKGQDNGQKRRRQGSLRLQRNVRLSRKPILKQTSITSLFSSPNNDVKTNSSDNGVSEHTQDSVTTTFESHMVLHTRCAECENSSRMKEVFLNVSVSPPTHEEDSSDEDSGDKSEWNVFREAMLAAETLSGDNKYWCDFCQRYNEATRSLHFLHLPPVLIIQLKRFSSSYNSVPGITKVSDYMPTPRKLGCLLDQCAHPCSDPAHSYHLYGIIGHAGISLTSGHYTALVKPAIVQFNGSKKTQNHLRELLIEVKNQVAENNEAAKLLVRTTRQKSKQQQQSKESPPSSDSSVASSSTKDDMNGFCCNLDTSDATCWLQYDDEKVNYVTEEELTSLLSSSSPKNLSWTPYLLFYSNDSYS